LFLVRKLKPIAVFPKYNGNPRTQRHGPGRLRCCPRSLGAGDHPPSDLFKVFRRHRELLPKNFIWDLEYHIDVIIAIVVWAKVILPCAIR